MGLQSFEYLVKGNVQGVNYRSWTVSQAKSLSLTGYVKNDSSGDVSGVAEGESENLAKFAKVLEKGPSAADVSKVSTSNEKDIEKGSYSSFDVQ